MQQGLLVNAAPPRDRSSRSRAIIPGLMDDEPNNEAPAGGGVSLPATITA